MENMDFKATLDREVFHLIAEAASQLNQDTYVIGGYVRDLLMGREGKDIDVVTVGSGIELALKVASISGKHLKVSVFKNFGTAMLRWNEYEIEFVGARKESYQQHSRKPAVEDGTLKDDQLRRDFTINTMGISLNKGDFGVFLDPFNGLHDLEAGMIRTPLDPDITFSDDPLRLFRAVRFASSLGFSIADETFDAMIRQKERISILSMERVTGELNKIILSPVPSIGFNLLDHSGLLPLILPELIAMKGVEVINNIGHKDNYLHTLEVLDNVAIESDDLWLRWSALLHDIAKPLTKKFVVGTGWTFHAHEFVGSKMVCDLFRRLRLPLNEPMKFVQKMVLLHLRPIALVERIVTDSAVRRLLFEAGDDIDSLMLLCKADITSKNEQKKSRYQNNFRLVEKKLKEIEAKDKIRNWQPPVTGELIMETFGIVPGREVGVIKSAIREAILDGVIPNEIDFAVQLMIDEGKKLGLEPLNKSLR